MAAFKTTLILFVLYAILAAAIGHAHHGGFHNQKGQGRFRRQAVAEFPQKDLGIQEGQDNQDVEDNQGPAKVSSTCDPAVDPMFSCLDCNTRQICKPSVTIVKACFNPYKPYCNNGICAAVPSAECA